MAASDSGSIWITPAGSGPTLASRGLVVSVLVVDGEGFRIAGYPFQDIALHDAGDNQLNICPGGSTADTNTDAFGEAEISHALAGGGSTVNGVQVYLGGAPVPTPPLAIRVNSPDLNGDRTVNVSDVGLFAGDFGSGVYRFRSDLVNDGTLNISDVGLFAAAVQETCP